MTLRLVIPQKLEISPGMVAVLISANLLEVAIGAAVLFHKGSTLFIVADALRRLAYKEPTA